MSQMKQKTTEPVPFWGEIYTHNVLLKSVILLVSNFILTFHNYVIKAAYFISMVSSAKTRY